jgi:hypothetical protein
MQLHAGSTINGDNLFRGGHVLAGYNKIAHLAGFFATLRIPAACLADRTWRKVVPGQFWRDGLDMRQNLFDDAAGVSRPLLALAFDAWRRETETRFGRAMCLRTRDEIRIDRHCRPRVFYPSVGAEHTKQGCARIAPRAGASLGIIRHGNARSEPQAFVEDFLEFENPVEFGPEDDSREWDRKLDGKRFFDACLRHAGQHNFLNLVRKVVLSLAAQFDVAKVDDKTCHVGFSSHWFQCGT